jgi:hypothetical protein
MLRSMMNMLKQSAKGFTLDGGSLSLWIFVHPKCFQVSWLCN